MRRGVVLVPLVVVLVACGSVPLQQAPRPSVVSLFDRPPGPSPGPRVPDGLARGSVWLEGMPAVAPAIPFADSEIAAQAEAVLRQHGAALGLTGDETWREPVVHRARLGPHIVQFQQQVGGIEVLNARINVVLDHGLVPRLVNGAFAAASPAAPFTLAPADAARDALAPLGIEGSLEPAGARHGYRYFALSGSDAFVAARPLRVKAVHYPSVGRLVPAYYLEVFGGFAGSDAPFGQALIVSAEDGALLHSAPLIAHAAHSYRVFADPVGRAYTDPFGDTAPHPTGLRDGWVPAVPAPMSLVARDHAGISTGDAWLPAGAGETRGNNVDAYFKGLPVVDGRYDSAWVSEFDPLTGDFRAPTTAPGMFDYAYDPALAAGDYFQTPGAPAAPMPAMPTQLNAKIVQGFYFANELHDLFYDHGFDEVSGNAQQDNYGRGGLDGDPLRVLAAQYGVFAGTPADGESPSMSMGRTIYSQARGSTSALDYGVLGHEWGHTMFGRLRPLPSSIQIGAINEGTADFIGLFVQLRETDRAAPGDGTPFSGAYASGAYFNRAYEMPGDPFPPAGSPGYPDNAYYRGTRRFPYSASFAHNPLTFAHIDVANELPPGAMPFDWKGRSLDNSEVHSAGEIWGNALWQCARNLVSDQPRLTFAEAHGRMLSYLVAGLKLFPPDADFVEARNAILFAMRAVDTADFERCRDGFAARGLGAGAVAPPRHAPGNRGAVESFSTADAALAFTGAALEEVSGGDGDGVLDIGEHGRLVVTLKNTGFDRLDGITVTGLPLAWAHAYAGGNTATGISLNPGEARTITFDVDIVTDLPAQVVGFFVTADAPAVHAGRGFEFSVNYDLVRDEFSDDWLISEQGFRNDWTSEVGPRHGCFWPCPRETFVWERVVHEYGEYAYRVDANRLGSDVSIRTVPFTAGAGMVRVRLEHDYTFSWGGYVEYRLDGGAWVTAATIIGGTAGALHTDSYDLVSGVGGRQVEVRLRFTADGGYTPNADYWAVSRVTIEGAATPVFSSMYVDVD